MVNEPTPNNNESDAAEKALRNIGSNLWFGGLSDEWQDFLISNTVEHFDTYEVSMQDAATNMLKAIQVIISKNPDLLDQNPWQVVTLEE